MRLPLFLAPALIAAAPLGAAPTAPDGPVTWGELFAPDRIVGIMANMSMTMFRSTVELTYADLDVDLRNGDVVLSEARLKPFVPGHPQQDCEISVARLTYSGGGLEVVDEALMRLTAEGAELGLGCLPPEALPFAAAAGVDHIRADVLRLHLLYDLPSGSADLSIEADFPGIAALTITADLGYMGMARIHDPIDPFRYGYGPLPYADLTRAEVTLEDQGLWSIAERMLPPDMLKADALAFGVSKGLSDVLTGFNDGAPLSPQQRALVQQTAEVARALPEGPREVVLRIDPDPAPIRLDARLGDMAMPDLFAAMNPSLRLGLVDATAMIAAIDLDRARTAPETLSAEARRRIGLAVLNGVGAPRDVALAQTLLGPVALQDETGALQIALAETLVTQDPERAYTLAMSAAAVRAPGALALLDSIEGELPLERVIALQPGLEAQMPLPGSRAALRSNARQAALGLGTPRSYARALYWGSMAATAGDAGGRGLVDALTARFARAGTTPEALLPGLSERVLGDWVAQDMPARLGGAAQ